MADALNRCMICGHRITSSFWVCAKCAERYGLASSVGEWPEWARQLRRDHKSMRRDERDRASYERDGNAVAATFEALAYGDYNTDLLDNANGDDDGASGGGTLRCVACGETFMDRWPTWPAPPRLWQEPRCPQCGAGWYENVG